MTLVCTSMACIIVSTRGIEPRYKPHFYFYFLLISCNINNYKFDISNPVSPNLRNLPQTAFSSRRLFNVSKSQLSTF